MRRFLLLGALCLGLACHQLNHGTVVGKTLHPAYTWLMPMYISSGGKDPVTTVIFIPMESPESYSVEVIGETAKGETRTETFWLDRGHYDEFTIGSKFLCGEDETITCVRERPSRRADGR